MQSTQWKRLGVFAFLDTGPPPIHQKDYVTLVMVHGRGGTADFFSRLLPLAGKLGARVVAINRRDYPGSTPFSEEDRALLFSTTYDTPAASDHADHYMKARAGEFYDFLSQLVKSEELPINSIILAGWSLGTAFVNSFLAYGPSFDLELWGAGLSQHIRRVIAYDPPSLAMGYPFPDGYYFPLNDPPISQEKEVFPSWVTGHYADGDTLETLSLRNALDEPSPTITRMSHEDLASTFHEPPTLLDGSDTVIQKSGVDRGVFSRLREAALFAPQHSEIAWPNVEFRYVCCDRSVWLMPWGIWSFGAEIDQVRKDGKRIRKHSVVRMKGANHCAHWDEPERTLRLLLSDAPSDINVQDVAKL
ncbi:alpha/beta-hydrolase [Lactarius akahatsu]|uniref:Alpha/beta-hydrolase n=1 Tax=Lactarius akahatsu TaxID=416441 RepID=A0AAD4LDD4_9AGAM|nr:alpha/beta-hydrolase [Lactarius akahatsu]